MQSKARTGFGTPQNRRFWHPWGPLMLIQQPYCGMPRLAAARTLQSTPSPSLVHVSDFCGTPKPAGPTGPHPFRSTKVGPKGSKQAEPNLHSQHTQLASDPLYKPFGNVSAVYCGYTAGTACTANVQPTVTCVAAMAVCLVWPGTTANCTHAASAISSPRHVRTATRALLQKVAPEGHTGSTQPDSGLADCREGT